MSLDGIFLFSYQLRLLPIYQQTSNDVIPCHCGHNSALVSTRKKSVICANYVLKTTVHDQALATKSVAISINCNHVYPACNSRPESKNAKKEEI